MRDIEVCCTSVNDVLEAWYGGAIRVELCSAISCGGVTPSHGLIANTVSAVKKLLSDAGASDSANGGVNVCVNEGVNNCVNEGPNVCVNEGANVCVDENVNDCVKDDVSDCSPRRFDVNVLIRPRDGEFCYTDSEIETMIADIRFCSEIGVDGVVVGALTPEGNVDMSACRRLMDAAGDMSITFHRAFDVCVEPSRALEDIIELGCDRLLTSGQRPDALSGSGLIKSLVSQSDGRISIMPGSGIKPGNILEIERVTTAREFHSTARKAVADLSRHHVPELGFEEPSASAPASVSASVPANVPASVIGDSDSRADDDVRYVMRTSRDVVRQLVEAVAD